MHAAIMEGPFRVRVGRWDTPEPGPGEVLVAVAATGICAGDMYIYKGTNPYAAYPVIGGHEIAGTVAALGPDVGGLQPGQAVVVEPFIGCGMCYPCRIGKQNCCANLQIIGVHQPGGFAEYVVAPAANIHQVPATLSPLLASFAEPVAIGVQACRRGAISAGEYVLILGCGPIGLALIEVVQARGAHPVAVDRVPSRLEAARSLGAETLAAGEDLLDRVLDQTNGEGAPVVVEATGSVAAMQQTIDLVASGGRIVIVGLVPRGTGVTLPGLDLTRKEVTLVGSRASVGCFPEAIELLASGAMTYPATASTFPMWEAPQVFADLAEHPARIQKGVLVV